MVEDIERLGAELEVTAFLFVDVEVLNQRKIALVPWRQPEDRVADLRKVGRQRDPRDARPPSSGRSTVGADGKGQHAPERGREEK